MPDTILIAEDEPRMRDVLRDYFVHNGAECDLARDGAEALDLLSDHDYDAILLDVMMPNLDGFAVCRAVRKRDKSVPILFLTALGGEDNTLYGYELGADDYITKPFSLRLVYAKTMALIRRNRGGGEEHTLTCGAISVNTATRAVKTFGREVTLPPRAFDLLLCLLRNHGRVLGREELLDKVWGVDFEGDRRAVDVQIRNLRACLGAAGSQIRTVPKAGYQLTEEGVTVEKRTISMRASVFWRCLLAFVLFWAVMMGVLTAREQRRAEGDLQAVLMAAFQAVDNEYNEKKPVWSEKWQVELGERMTTQFLTLSKYGSLSYRYLDRYSGEELARSTVSGGGVKYKGVDYSLMLDEVLSDEEQLALALALKAADEKLPDAHGTVVFGGVSPYRDCFPQTYLPSRKGRVVGVVEGERIYPKTIIFTEEGEECTVLDAEAPSLEGKELTTLKFNSGYVYTTLCGNDPAEQLAERRALDAWADEWLADPAVTVQSVPQGGLSIRYNGPYSIRQWNLYGQQSVLAYEVDTLAAAVDSIAEQGTYLWTFLAMVVLAFLLSLALSWALSEPLAKLSRAVEDENLPYTPDTRIREVNVMARAVNDAQKRLSDDLDRQRELTRAVAHELKTPAAVVRAYAEGLAEDIAPEKREEYLHVLVEESDRMGALVGELLEFSRLEQGRALLEPETVDLAELTERAFRRLELPMEQRGLRLELDLSPVSLTADPARLGQVLNNLAANALRYADPGAVTVRLTSGGGLARLSVENACAPIPPEVMERLFEPFYRPDKARSRELGGSGLGLAIVANVVRLHGGTCGAEGIAGGVRFTVELPMGKEERT